MILSFIEAVRIFSMTDDQFDARFNSRYMPELSPLIALRDNGTITLDEYEDRRQAIADHG